MLGPVQESGYLAGLGAGHVWQPIRKSSACDSQQSHTLGNYRQIHLSADVELRQAEGHTHPHIGLEIHPTPEQQSLSFGL